MEIARLILEYLRILVWPVVAIVLLVVLQKPLKALLPRLTSAEVFGVKATLAADISRLAQQAQHVKEVSRAEVGQTNVQVVRVGGVSLSPEPDGGVRVDGTGDIVYSKVPDPERVLPLRNPPTFSRRTSLIRIAHDVQQFFYDVSFDVLAALDSKYADQITAAKHKNLPVNQIAKSLHEVTGLEVWSQLGNVVADAMEIAEEARRTEPPAEMLEKMAGVYAGIIDSIRTASLDTMVKQGYGVQMELGTRALVD